MRTGRALLRRVGAVVQIATVQAAPSDGCRSVKNTIFDDVSGKIVVSFLVLTFGNSNIFKNLSDLFKTILAGDLGIAGIHLGLFKMFTNSGRLQIFER